MGSEKRWNGWMTWWRHDRLNLLWRIQPHNNSCQFLNEGEPLEKMGFRCCLWFYNLYIHTIFSLVVSLQFIGCLLEAPPQGDTPAVPSELLKVNPFLFQLSFCISDKIINTWMSFDKSFILTSQTRKLRWHKWCLAHTSYLSFLLHRQDFQKPNFTPTPKKTTKGTKNTKNVSEKIKYICIFFTQSGKIYTWQKIFTQTCLWCLWQIWGMAKYWTKV